MCDSCKEQVKNAELCHFQGKVSCLQCELVFLSNVWINYFGHSFSAMFAVQRSELKWPRNNSLTEPDTLAHIQREIYHFTHRRSSSKCSSVILGQLLQFLLYQVALYTQANILLLPALESVCSGTDILVEKLPQRSTACFLGSTVPSEGTALATPGPQDWACAAASHWCWSPLVLLWRECSLERLVYRFLPVAKTTQPGNPLFCSSLFFETTLFVSL